MADLIQVRGGVAYVGRTRIPVWTLVRYAQLGMTVPELLEAYPSITAADIDAASAYMLTHTDEIARQLHENSEEHG